MHQTIFVNFWRFIFPPICQGCGVVGHWLCDFCLAKLEFYPNPIQLDPKLSHLDSVSAITYFQSPIKELLIALKYHKYPVIGAWLGNWVLEVIQPPEATFISWVPLHPKKQNWRGFNQAEIIGRALATQLKLPCATLCQKLADTTSQAKISDRTERLSHLQNQFRLLPQLDTLAGKYWLKQQRILLIDDVVTTGATLDAAAKPLKDFGALAVHGLAIAHGQ